VAGTAHDRDGEAALRRGIDLVRAGDGFAAHEVFEELWRAAPPTERDFLQGLVHVAVAPYQHARGHEVGCASQLRKARRRLAAYAPCHRGVDVRSILAWCDASLAAGGAPPRPPL
jgi:predicted metal-dependent hydrolase